MVRFRYSCYMTKKQQAHNETGIAHVGLVLLAVVLLTVGLVGYRVYSKNNANKASVNDHPVTQVNKSANSLGDPNSSDPTTKGKALSGGQCTGKGSKPLTHAPMDMKDVVTIQPYGLMVDGHVTPVDHEYYYPAINSAPDSYPVYADADGTIVSIGSETSTKWAVVISHNSCTFFSWYNLMTSLSKNITDKMPAGWGPNNQGGISIAVKSGDLLGYVGGQSLDYAVWNTEKTLKGLLNPVAYNNSEPGKINTVPPLDYFTQAVRSQILPKYIRTAQPLDGTLAYDVDGQAVGTWFLAGTNGYAGSNDPSHPSGYWSGHLSLAYNYLDPAAMEFSIGDYQGQPKQFAVKSGPNWTKITPSSGIAKVELAQLNMVNSSGTVWTGQFDKGVTLQPGTTMATALLQLTGKQTMKVEVFPGKTPSQVSGFDSNAKTYDRGQTAHMITSTTAH